VAVIGAGGRGDGHVKDLKDENIVALCDVDERRAARSFEAHPNATKYKDWRQLLDREKNLDAVTVATPDHMHAPIALAAMKRGLHCYCEKPLTWSIGEARDLALAAEKSKVATQMGNQGSAEGGFRRGVELLRGGVLGEVHEVHVWTNRPVWPQALMRPEEENTPPAHVDWDLWLGVAPARPYHDGLHPFKWRGWFEFGTGALGDMACHTVNLAWRGLELVAPEVVEAETTEPFPETFPAGSRITWQVPARGEKPPVRLVWYDGTMKPDARLLPAKLVGGKPPIAGLLIIGEKGMMFSPDDYGSTQRWFPEGIAGVEIPESLPRSPGQVAEWVQACKGGPKTFSDFAYAGPFTEAVLLGNLAIRTGKKIEWDSQNLKAKGVPEAEPMIHREYRKGFEV
jgi:predicted dehydrogenase